VSDSKGPLANARLALKKDGDASFLNFALSDSTGTYQFRVPPGKYKLAAIDDYTNNFSGVNFDDYQSETIELSAGDKIVKDLVKQKP
jgi:hypothetical protein